MTDAEFSDLFAKERPATPECLAEVYGHLRAAIYGQEDAVRAAASMESARRRGDPRNMLFVGPTGCGKTEIFRQLRELYHEVYILDASSLTAEGWKGEVKVKNLLALAVGKELERDKDQGAAAATKWAEHGIIVFDEIDKALLPAGGDYKGHIQLQGELLSLIEGTDVIVKLENSASIYLNTKGMSFAFLGAFAELYERRAFKSKRPIGFGSSEPDECNDGVTADELEAYGVIPELLGRFHRIVTLHGMTEDDYLAAMTGPDSVLARAVAEKDLIVPFGDGEIRSMAREAAENGLGLRWIRKQVDKKYDDYMLGLAGIGGGTEPGV